MSESDLIEPVTPSPAELEAEREEMIANLMDRLDDIDAVRAAADDQVIAELEDQGADD